MTTRQKHKKDRPRKSFYLDEELEAAIEALASADGEAVAVVLRRLLRLGLRASAAPGAHT